MKKILLILLPLIALLAGCSKEEESTTKPYLDGSVILGYPPEFIAADDKVTYYPHGVTHPKGNAMGLYFSISSLKPANDTVYYADPQAGQPGPLPADYNGVEVVVDFGEYTAERPDTLGTFTLTFTIYPIDKSSYNALSAYRTATIVDEENSIPEITCDGYNYPGKAIFEDKREQKTRAYAEIPLGGRTWMSRNLCSNVDSLGNALSPSALAYKNCEVMSYIYGRYYSWEQAQKACPKGWKLPSLADYDAMWQAAGRMSADIFSPAEFNSEPMWEYWPSVGEITNSTSFSAIPTGYVNIPAGHYIGTYQYAAFWTSDQTDVSNGAYVYFYEKENDMKTASASKQDRGMSVRCIKK